MPLLNKQPCPMLPSHVRCRPTGSGTGLGQIFRYNIIDIIAPKLASEQNRDYIFGNDNFHFSRIFFSYTPERADCLITNR